jgi:predicted transcriptional regulator
MYKNMTSTFQDARLEFKDAYTELHNRMIEAGEKYDDFREDYYDLQCKINQLQKEVNAYIDDDEERYEHCISARLADIKRYEEKQEELHDAFTEQLEIIQELEEAEKQLDSEAEKKPSSIRK